MGTYSDDRQPTRRTAAARARPRAGRRARFVVAGPQYPADIAWPANVQTSEHLPPAEHRAFYNRQRFTLNVTRADMIAAGWSPSVRLFEAAACGTPIISDRWAGLETLLVPGPRDPPRVDRGTRCCRCCATCPRTSARAIGERARERILAAHTAAHRAERARRLCAGAADGGHPRRTRRHDVDTRELQRQIDALGPVVPQPAPARRRADAAAALPRRRLPALQVASRSRRTCRHDLTGWRVLDVGCNAGFYSFELARRGASVLAIDVDAALPGQARWARGQLRARPTASSSARCGVYDLGAQRARASTWSGSWACFYHLRYPLLALDLLAKRTRRLMVFQTLTMPGDRSTRTRRPPDRRARAAARARLAEDGLHRASRSPATRPTGGRPTMRPARRCCARSGLQVVTPARRTRSTCASRSPNGARIPLQARSCRACSTHSQPSRADLRRPSAADWPRAIVRCAQALRRSGAQAQSCFFAMARASSSLPIDERPGMSSFLARSYNSLRV